MLYERLVVMLVEGVGLEAWFELGLDRRVTVVFFFSSRRRHTRYIGDWSSDVCSSDLRRDQRRPPIATTATGVVRSTPLLRPRTVRSALGPSGTPPRSMRRAMGLKRGKIGRASCRERGKIWVGEEARKKVI